MNTYYSYLLPSFSFLLSSLVTVPFPFWVELSKLLTVAKSVAEDRRTYKKKIMLILTWRLNHSWLWLTSVVLESTIHATK